MKRVLVLITTSFVPYGGLTTVMMNYYRNILKEGLEIDFASTNNDISEELINELKKNKSSYYCLGKRKQHFFQYCFYLNRLLKLKKYDVIHINANSALISVELVIALINGVKKRIVHIHNSSGDYPYIHKILRPIYKGLYTEGIACSEKAGKWGFGNSPYFTLNNAIDIEQYRFSLEERNMTRESLDISEDFFVIGNVGKMGPAKNHPFLIDLFNEIYRSDNRTRLLLVGGGELLQEMKEKVKKLMLEEVVIFVGMVENTAPFLAAMDCFVFPSLWEGFPLSLVEAQASGLKCVVSDAVASETDLTGAVIFLSLQESYSVWIKACMDCQGGDRQKRSQDNIEQIRNKGFDVARNAQYLREIYMRV